MESPRRWINRYQPQTLVTGTMLLYLEGFFSLLRGSSVLLVTGLAMFPAGFLVANDKRIGWQVGVVAAAVGVLERIRLVGFETRLLIVLVFPAALLALLLHPMSREHQRIRFE